MSVERPPHESAAPGIRCRLGEQARVEIGAETLAPFRLPPELLGELRSLVR